MVIDDADLGPDTELGRRWAAIRVKLVANQALLSQGGLVAKLSSSGRRTFAVRYVDRSAKVPVHRSIFVGPDDRLVELTRRQLEHLRMAGDLTREISAHASLMASASVAVRRLAAGCRRAMG